MFSFFAKLFGYLLNFIYSFVNNYGVAIIIFSVLLKLVMLPISIKQQKTLKKSAKMQAMVKEIEEKYSNDKVRQSQELMDLYKRENMSPFSGCLSSILQFIIIISMFYLVSSPLTYMKNVDPEVINNYVEQIETETGERLRYREIAVIKSVGNNDEKINLNMNFLGLDLSDVPSQSFNDIKVFIIPVLYVITSIYSLKIVNAMNKKPNSKDNKEEQKSNNDEKSLVPKDNSDAEAMEEMQKQMNLMMPFMTVSIALIAPLGLALYWLVNNVIMIIERIVINKFIKDEGEE